MIITATSSTYRNDNGSDLDLSVQCLLDKLGSRFLMNLRGCRNAIVHIDEAVGRFRQSIPQQFLERHRLSHIIAHQRRIGVQ